MSNPILLDATPLSLLCHGDQRKPIVVEINAWLRRQLRDGTRVIVPEIADYEVRRELVRAAKHRSIGRLDRLTEALEYLPIDTEVMRRAADLWAQARNEGAPLAPPEALDADVILAALAERVDGIVATDNIGHLGRFVIARSWRHIEPAE